MTRDFDNGLVRQPVASDDDSISIHSLSPVAGRYQVIRELGRGGMATVFEVHDLSRDTRVALKRLRPSSFSHAAVEGLFKLEYHSLCQLKHPAIVHALDYGSDEHGAFYTMELLDGSDLKTLSPLPWKKLCEVLVPICSALSLLHSRRFVHRDVTPRNIHCSAEGQTKLIDFGAMAVAGPCSEVVGTPQFCAPEMLGTQTIDSRTDLFALGATAYWALTGRHAYPARHFSALSHSWSQQPPAPSACVPGIPAQLDALIMSMLSLDPLLRPHSAAEVMQRIAAIANIPCEQGVAASHYLATPTLVAREHVLARARRQLARAARGVGGTLLISSPPGGGRSRCLDACVLEAKLAGAQVLRAGRVGNQSSWECARTLLVELRKVLGDAWPTACPGAARLIEAFPVLAPERASSIAHIRLSLPPRQLSSPPLARATIMELAADAFLGLASNHRLAIAIDDIEAVDEPSASLLALLAMRARKHGLWLVIATNPDAKATSQPALDALLRSATYVKLHPLELEETRRLLGSVMGEVPHIDLLADRLQKASHGRPRTIVRLAQHLIDAGVISFRAGSFVLPEHLTLAQLPLSDGDIDLLGLANLSPPARALAELLALYPDRRVSLEALEALAKTVPDSTPVELIAELRSTRFLSVDGTDCALSSRDLRAALLDALPTETKRKHCRELGQIGANDGWHFAINVNYLTRADQWEEALDLLLKYLDDAGSTAEVGDALAEQLALLPQGWTSTCAALLAYGERSHRPRRATHRIRAYLCSIGVLLNEDVNEEILVLLDQLAHDCGLDIHAQLEDTVPANERLNRALQLAQARFQDAPERQRVLPPGEAIPLLARTSSQAMATMFASADISLLERVPDMSPLCALSPALALLQQNVVLTRRYAGGAYEEACAGYRAMIKRMDQPDHCGLDTHTHRYVRLSLLYAIGQMEMVSGRERCLANTEELEQDPMFATGAWMLRLCYAVQCGNVERIEECRSQLELRSIREQQRPIYATGTLWLTLQCYARCDDLLRVQECIPALEQVVKRFPAWKPRLLFARAVHRRICGDYAAALVEIEAAAALVAPGRASAWAGIAFEHARILRLCGQPEAARELATTNLSLAAAAGLVIARWWIRLELGLAELALGEYECAREHVQAVITMLEEADVSGVSLGEAYEARARIALAAGDPMAFTKYLRKCSAYYLPGRSPTLTARYERLLQDGREVGVAESAAQGPDNLSAQTSTKHGTSAFSTYEGAASRAQYSLDALVEWAGSSMGYLYVLQSDSPRLVARSSGSPISTAADDFVYTLFKAKLANTNDITETATNDASLHNHGFEADDGSLYTSYILVHPDPGPRQVVGVLLLRDDRPRTKEPAFEMLAKLSEAIIDAPRTVTTWRPLRQLTTRRPQQG